MVFHGKRLEFFHRTDAFRRFDRSRRGKASIRMQQACKRHAGKRLVAESIFVGVLGFGQSNFGTQAFRLANLTTFFKLLGAVQMFFKIFLGRLAHHDKFFAQAKREILCRHIHEDRILRHLKFGLAGVHVLLGGIVCRINLETRKDGPYNSEAGVKEPIVLHLHVEIGILDLFSRFLPFALGHLHSGIVCILAIHDTAPDIGGLGIHISLGRFFVHAGGHRLRNRFLVCFRISAVVGGKVSLRISGSTRDIGKWLLNTP